MRYAFRSLTRTPAFAAMIVLTLALGIGANTAIFSFFHGILLRPLPYEEPERIVLLKKVAADYSEPAGTEIGVLAADFRELQPVTRSLQTLSTYTLDSATVTGRGPADLATTVVVSPNFFSLLGTPAQLGRTFSEHDLDESSGRLAIVSHEYWRTRFGGDPDILGQSITLNQVPFTVVGIMPPEFDFPREAMLWVTPAADVPEVAIGQPPQDQSGRGNYLRTVLGRLAPGVSREQAEQELASLIERLPNPANLLRPTHLVTLRDQSVGNVRPALVVLLGCVGLVLLIACLNVANLMLTRATARQHEIGIRLALGASRARIAQHLLGESLLLALLGGALGLLVSVWALDLLIVVAPDDIPRLGTVRIDGWVLVFTLVISLLTGIVSGLGPLFGAGGAAFMAAARSGERSGSATPATRRLRSTLVAGEVAISLVLLIAAGLLLRSLSQMQAVSWGFQPTQVVTARVAFLEERYASEASRIAFYRQLLERLERTPGIESVGTSLDRIGQSWITLPFTPEGQAYATPADRPQANYHIINVDYFRTLGIPLLQGRLFTEHDDANGQPVVIIDALLARQHFPDGQAVGRTLRSAGVDREIDAEIVGVAATVKSDGPLGPQRPEVYIPFLQIPVNNFFVHVRTPLDASTAERAIKRAVHAIDADLPVTDVATMEQVIARPTAGRRFPLALLSAFAGLALLLAAIGIYAVTAYDVAQRTREIGVRMALGAEPRSIVRLVVRQALRPIAIGFGAGLAGAAATAWGMRQLLFGVAPLDLTTFAIVPVLLASVALAACLLPARRATRVDPIIALRAE